MECRSLTESEIDCIVWALREAGVADEDVVQAALRRFQLFRFRPTIRHVRGLRTLVALVALRTRASGITLGDRVFVRADQLDDELRGSLQLIAHEAAHVVQFARDGTPTFLTKYIGSYLTGLLTGSSDRDAYLNIPYEREAREVARLALERYAETCDEPSDDDARYSESAR